MSFSKPEHITVRSIILIVCGWVLFSLFWCCRAAKNKFRHNFPLDFAGMDLLLLACYLFYFQSFLPRENCSRIIRQVGRCYFLQVHQKLSVVRSRRGWNFGAKWKTGCWKCLNVRRACENKADLHKKGCVWLPQTQRTNKRLMKLAAY